MVTLRDVAQAAETSVSAVSTVLNGRAEAGRISARLRERIEITARELGYRCNQLARSMATGLTRTIALFSDTGEHCEYFYELTAGILEAAARRQYALKVYRTDQQSEESILAHLLGERPGGVILLVIDPERMLRLARALDEANIPYGTLNAVNYSGRGFRVDSDDEPGVAAATNHLAELGHRRIAYLDYVLDIASCHSRRTGYLDAMRQLGLTADVITLPDQMGPTTALSERLQQAPLERPTAIISYSDALALLAFGCAYSLALHIPTDLSLVGFAGLSLAKFSPVPLTTVRQPFQEMGRQATELLLERIDHPERMAEAYTLLLPVMLDPGKSSAPAPCL